MSDPSLPPPAGEMAWTGAAPSRSPRLIPIRDQAIRAQGRVDGGRQILRIVAIVAAVAWVLAVLLTFAAQWHEVSSAGSPAASFGSGVINGQTQVDGWSVVDVAASTLAATWGYALVAVAAWVASLWFDDGRARDLFELLDDADGDGDDDDGEGQGEGDGFLDQLPPPGPPSPPTGPS